mgnify:CR=1 FL=1
MEDAIYPFSFSYVYASETKTEKEDMIQESETISIESVFIESVFEKKNNEYKKLSHLNWQHLNNVYLGGNVTFSFWDFDLSVSAAGFIPKRSGTMDDSDWINLDSVKNIYSISENYLWRSAFAGVNLQYDFDILNWLYFH